MKVKNLTQRLAGFKKDKNHVLVRRNFQHQNIKHKNKEDTLLPNDDVNNGGYYKSYKLLTNDQFETDIVKANQEDTR